MIAFFHHNERQHRFSVSIQREVLKTLEITVLFHFYIYQVNYWKVLLVQPDSFLNQHNLVTDSKRGFRKGRSSELLLLGMTEKWRLALDEVKSIGIIFIDFQKAFDCVSSNFT